MRVPTVGSKVLHPVQVAPPIRKLEAHRTKEAARRTAAPKLGADRAAFRIANQEYGAQARSAKAATGLVSSELTNALKGIPQDGLNGTYRRQLEEQLGGLQGQAANALPSLLAGAQEEHRAALTKDRTQLVQDRAAMQSSASAALNQRLKELRGEGSSALKTEGEHAEKREKALQNALLIAKNGYNELLSLARSGKSTKGTSTEPAVPYAKILSESAGPEANAWWLKFAKHISTTSGGEDPNTALKAVEILRRLLRSREHSGRSYQPGVPLGPRVQPFE
jgi:hypothetical protein